MHLRTRNKYVYAFSKYVSMFFFFIFCIYLLVIMRIYQSFLRILTKLYNRVLDIKKEINQLLIR